MKKILTYLLVAVLAAVGCKKDNYLETTDEQVADFMEEVFWDQTGKPDAEVISKEILTPEEMADSIFGADETLDDTALTAKQKFLDECARAQKELQMENPDNPNIYFAFEKQNISYLTVDQAGNRRLELSAFIGYAVYPTLHGFETCYAKNVVFCCPYTHTLEGECATESNGGQEFLTMWAENLFIMPDGQGFGVDKNHTQTYLNHELHARQYYDAMKAGIWYYEHGGGESGGKFKKDWKMRIIGASQGAGDAIAFHKYLDTKSKQLDLSEYYDGGKRSEAESLCKQYGFPIGSRFVEVPLGDIHRFDYSVVCCGPYCPEVTMQTYRKWGGMSYPCVIPLVIKSMLECYPKELPYKEEDFFSETWNQNKAELDKIYLEKTMDSDALNIFLSKKLSPDGKYYSFLLLENMLSENMLKEDSQIYRDLIACLKKQDLTTGWTPRTKTKIYFSDNDEVVPYDNTKCLTDLLDSTQSEYKMVDCSTLGPYEVGHVAACEAFYLTESLFY